MLSVLPSLGYERIGSAENARQTSSRLGQFAWFARKVELWEGKGRKMCCPRYAWAVSIVIAVNPYALLRYLSNGVLLLEDVYL